MPAVNTLILPLGILAALLFAGLIWLAGDVFALFLIAFFLAYLFDPLVARLARHGISRPWGSALITCGLVVVIGVALALLGPLLYGQLEELFKILRDLVSTVTDKITTILTPYFPSLKETGLAGVFKSSDPQVSNLTGPLAAVFSGGMAFANILALALLSPVITFYLLKDWQTMSAAIVKMAPPHRRPAMQKLGKEIDSVLSAFLHGQAWVCLCDGVLYAIGLYASGLNYAIAIGILAGALKFLPYVGTVIGAGIGLGIAVGQGGWDGWLLAGVGLTFIVVEVIENAILYPRIVGTRVQLHPALVIFAVLLGGKLLGILGVFIAVPAFAVGRVVLSFWFGSHPLTFDDAEAESSSAFGKP